MPERSQIITLPHFQQSADGYCLSACARMALAYLGLAPTEAEISKILDAKEFGTPSFAIQRLEALNVRVAYCEWAIAELLYLLRNGQPMILFLRTGFLDYGQQDFAHAVIVVGAEEKSAFWLHDPALKNSPVRTMWDGVLAAWAEFSYRGAIICR